MQAHAFGSELERKVGDDTKLHGGSGHANEPAGPADTRKLLQASVWQQLFI
jgi:hypothetical protein